MNRDASSSKTVMITGGHVTPAIATIEELVRRFPDWRLVFVGRKVAIEGTRVVSEEYRLITAMGLPFLPLTAGRLKHDWGWLAVWSFLKIPVGFVQAFGYLIRVRPNIILSFGGYIALPVVLAGWLLRIPIITHEQTSRPGVANRIIDFLAHRICVSFPDEMHTFWHAPIFTGLPMRKHTFIPPQKAPFLLDRSVPLLFVTGGATGAVSVNNIVYEALPKLTREFSIIHQVGRLSIEKARHIELPAKGHARYVPVPYLTESQYSWVLSSSDLVIGRAGANTVMELAALGKMGLFIPLPWASQNEQYYNAKYLADRGTSIVLPQNRLTAQMLVDTVREMMAKRKQFEQAARRLAKTIPRNGATALVDVISEVVRSA